MESSASVLYVHAKSVGTLTKFSRVIFSFPGGNAMTSLTFVHNILLVDITLNEAYMWDNASLWFQLLFQAAVPE